MLTTQQYLELVNDRGRRGLSLERVYRGIRSEEMFLAAYGKLYKNKGAMTPGVDPEDTVDGMSMGRIRDIIQQLELGEYRWSPTRRVEIPNPKGGTRKLSVAGWKDKLLQEVIRSVLEAYYEPQFSERSHGYRPDKGCHTALQEIAVTWKGTIWFIEGDIKGCFDNIDHGTLLGILGNKIRDNRLMKLLRQMLEAGYMEDWKWNRTYSGTPQGGVLSPLLANIYLNELDQFIENELMPRYNRGERRRRNPAYNFWNNKHKWAKKTGEVKWAKVLKKELMQTPSGDPNDPDYRRLKYIRYADDFLLGFAGPKEEAETIKREIGDFLKQRLLLQIAEDKTHITHASTKPAKFLGYDVQVEKRNAVLGNQGRSVNGQVFLRVPQEVQAEWIRKFTREGKPIHRPELLNEDDFDIIAQFGAEFRGLVNYYTMAINVKSMFRIKGVMLEALIRTLAAKHKTARTAIYKKYYTEFEKGLSGVTLKIEREGKKPLTANFGNVRIHYQRMVEGINDGRWTPNPNRTQLIDRLTADTCELCGEGGDMEVHHVRKLADIKKMYRHKKQPVWVANMIAKQRKTIVVCLEFHRRIHAGTHDGSTTRSWRAV
ncbi:MAG TPA: reverse transcriptase domain-containing protein [Nitrospiraceae bacterium]|nr:reverse transcriptase domain-containing protein [Nitrospiraceae bacterium]